MHKPHLLGLLVLAIALSNALAIREPELVFEPSIDEDEVAVQDLEYPWDVFYKGHPNKLRIMKENPGNDECDKCQVKAFRKCFEFKIRANIKRAIAFGKCDNQVATDCQDNCWGKRVVILPDRLKAMHDDNSCPVCKRHHSAMCKEAADSPKQRTVCPSKAEKICGRQGWCRKEYKQEESAADKKLEAETVFKPVRLEEVEEEKTARGFVGSRSPKTKTAKKAKKTAKTSPKSSKRAARRAEKRAELLAKKKAREAMEKAARDAKRKIKEAKAKARAARRKQRRDMEAARRLARIAREKAAATRPIPRNASSRARSAARAARRAARRQLRRRIRREQKRAKALKRRLRKARARARKLAARRLRRCRKTKRSRRGCPKPKRSCKRVHRRVCRHVRRRGRRRRVCRRKRVRVCGSRRRR
mmetsp:Transcript_27693/g.63780  ORF Transcript_27693/g.63780 Transcript_27693/m.63780 type:complete len:417 (-) Transcript_27693:72-1322(-)